MGYAPEMSISTSLGTSHDVRLSQGLVRYREGGEGPAVVFVHGALVNGDLWRKVVPLLAGRFRCVTPDWPLGAHEVPLDAGADCSPRGMALLVAEFLAALDLRDAVLVGNDSGGMLSQLVAAHHPDRVGAVVLTPCDAFDQWWPRVFQYLRLAARIPGALRLVVESMRLHALRRLPIAFGWLAKRGIDDAIVDSYVANALGSRGVRRDGAAFLAAMGPTDLAEAEAGLRAFARPVLVVWPPEDRVFPRQLADRLARTFPDARLALLDDSYGFVSEDQPERLAAEIARFLDAALAASPAPG
jgi:pimeloyl-ACP methyl ester carboxylesterase